MPEPRLEILLLRTLTAIAWADGSVDAEEAAFVRGLIAEYGLPAEEAGEILALLDRPLSLEEFEGYARAFLRAGRAEDRADLLSRAERIVEANGATGRSELRYLHLLTVWTKEAQKPESSDGVVLGRFGRLLGKAAPTSLGAAVRGLFQGTGVHPERSPREAYVGLFGALLYRVVYADRVVDAAEAAHLRNLLGGRFGFAPGEVDTMLRLIQQRVAEDHDRQRLCAEFNRVTGPEERHELLAALLGLAAADGEVSPDEEKEIRLIANYLWIEVQDFVAIRKDVLGR